jgi:carboxyl-terminal processing protease
MVARMSMKKVVFLAVSVALLLTLVGGVVFGQSAQKDKYRYLSIFTEVYDLVRNNYVEQVSSDQLMDGAFNGVTDAIDEFSYYVPPTQMSSYKNFVDVEDNGNGLVVTKRFGYAYVISAIPGSPAAAAGIERGDFIEKVGGQPTSRMAVWQVRNALRAPKVEVQVLRGGNTKRDTFTVEQKTFHPLALSTQTYGSVGYIKIPYFEKGTAAQLKTALENVRKNNVRKLIIDVRGNAGGDIDEAISAADELLTSGLITSVEGRNIEAKRWQADRNTDYDGALEVLADNSTAAGGEIFAAAIHGNSRGKVVGITTYGKSVLQRFIPLQTGGGVYMTVAHFTTPEMKPIKDGGIRPDVIVDLTSLALRNPEEKGQSNKPKEDLILNKALSLFSETASTTPAKNAA